MHPYAARTLVVLLALSSVACSGTKSVVGDAGVDTPTIDAPTIDTPAVDTPTTDAPRADAADASRPDISAIDAPDVSLVDVVDAGSIVDVLDAGAVDRPDVVLAPDVVDGGTPIDAPDVADAADVVDVTDAPDIVDLPAVDAGALTWDPSTADSFTELSSDNLGITGYAPFCAAGVRATRTRTTGRWYWEHRASRDGGSNDTACPVGIGISSPDGATRAAFYGHHGNHSYLTSGAAVCTLAGAPVPVDSGAVIGVAWDADVGTVDFYVSGVRVSSCTVPSGTYFPYGSHCNDSFHHCSGTTNFGASPFAHAPPSGYASML